MPVIVAFVVGTIVTLTILWLSARAAVTVCVARVTNGKLEVVRGEVSPRLLGDLRDVVKKPRVKRATIRIVRAKDKARVEMSGGLDEAQRQRVRNVVGVLTLAQVTGGKKK
jgi:hypothetical protein